jgi:hypothetical protein
MHSRYSNIYLNLSLFSYDTSAYELDFELVNLIKEESWKSYRALLV